MEYRKQHILLVVVSSIISVGMVLSVLSLLMPTSHQIYAQDKDKKQQQSGMNTGSMNTNMTMHQMLDMMDMMHNMMMNMMRMMANSGAMNGGNMTGSMTTMGGMQ